MADKLTGKVVGGALKDWLEAEFKLEVYLEASFRTDGNTKRAFRNPNRRADLAGFAKTAAWGFEIKSDYDSLKSWRDQREDYQKCFHYCYLVVSEKNRPAALDLLSRPKTHYNSAGPDPYWGLITYRAVQSLAGNTLWFKRILKPLRGSPARQIWADSISTGAAWEFFQSVDWSKVERVQNPPLRAAAAALLTSMGVLANLEAFRKSVADRTGWRR